MDWVEEREDIIRRFSEELRKATGDGSIKRQRGEKPPWHQDDSHLDAMHRHIGRYYLDPTGRDKDSGAHHLVAVAWRALAIASIETGNIPNGRD